MLAPRKALDGSTATVRAIQAAVILAVFGGWYLLTATHAVNALLLPAPGAVVAALRRLVGTASFWSAVGVTTITTAVAYALAVIAGVTAGFFVGRSPLLTSAYRPLLAGIFAIPITLFFPLIVVLLGIGPPSKVAFGALYGFFPIALSTIAGFAGIDRLYVRAARSQGASPAAILRHVYLPGAMPVVLGGLRIGFFITFASVLGAETLSSIEGVGHAIAHEAELLEAPAMYAWIVVVLTVTVLLNALLTAIERRGTRV
jgi:ABC-type nitrate/sulfonate/bicarbonate transport system permease component